MIKTADILIRNAQEHIECIDASTARKIHDENPEAVILDVREAETARESKLADSVNIPRGLIEMQLPNLHENPDTLIMIHCGGGGRASLAAYTLKQMGYQNVRAIAAPYDTIKAAFDH